jgi:hypothetical protein
MTAENPHVGTSLAATIPETAGIIIQAGIK